MKNNKKIRQNLGEKMKEVPVGYSSDIKKNIRHVFWLYFVLFAMLVIYLIKFVLIDSDRIIEHSANPRIEMVSHELVRGKILDAKGNVLAVTKKQGDTFQREYPYGKTFAHLVGFSQLGQAGIESKYNFVLQKLDNEVLQRVNKIFTNEPLEGNSIALTVDADLQEMIVKALGKQRGAIVVMEPSTGKILAMASYPNYDPNLIGIQWNDLKENKEQSPLLNRATQGLYPPGSVFKIVTAATAFEKLENYDTFEYICEGEEYFGDKRIRCFDSRVHGKEHMIDAFAVSCNTFFSTIGLMMNREDLRATSERLLFNQEYNLPLEYSKSSFVLNGNSSDTEVVETAIGQGKTVVSPMHMAMITSAVANGGVMMEPYLVDHEITKSGSIKNKHLPKDMGQVLTLEETEYVKNMMIKAISEGTGNRAFIKGKNVAGKTGTAENAAGDDHGWFVAFAPAEKPEVVVSVVLENSGGPRKAMTIAKSIMEYVLQ